MRSEAFSDPPERGSMRWYLNRAAVMSPAELPHRAVSAGYGLIDRTLRKLGLEATVPQYKQLAETPAPWLGVPKSLTPEVTDALIREADQIVEGQIVRLDGLVLELGSPPDWYRTLTVGDSDIRHAMELHRHAHLPRLAQAWALTGEIRYRQALLAQLESWLDQCPCPHGVGWASALDVGLRLLNWSTAWQLLACDRDPALPQALRDRWLRSVYEHAKFIRQNRSRHSSANNHLLGELLGLVTAKHCWPLWPDVLAWGRSAERELSAEALRQTHADGVSREQASWYQVFVFELLAAFVSMQRSQGLTVEPRLLRRMGAMAVFIAALRDSCGNVSEHGDADHAHALPLAARHEDGYAGLLSLAVRLDIAPEVAPLIRQPSSVASWLRNPSNEWRHGMQHPLPLGAEARKRLPRAFPEGGYYLLGQAFGSDHEVLATFDAGPLGYLGIAAHGHADALSVRLSVAGQPVLVDRGTFSYNSDARRRRYLRGTLAHNTVCVDEQDQSVYGGPFLWLRKARTGPVSFVSDDAMGKAEAWHDGYRRLPDAVIHQRSVDWDGPARRFMVRDTLAARADHELQVCWHFDPACQVELHEGVAVARVANVCVRLSMAPETSAGRWLLHRGDPQSVLGWHSPRFGELLAASSLIWHASTRGTTTVCTRIDVLINPQPTSI